MKRMVTRSGSMMSRRAFLSTTAASATGLAIGFRHRNVFANATGTPYVPRPNKSQYVLRIAPTKLNPDGKQTVAAVTVNGIFPGPEIRVREGDQLRIRVENLLDQPTSIHWHGLLVPASMDGVPDVSNAPIAAGRVFVYEFPILQTGTYWYHSHSDMQEQIGLAGPFVIEEANSPGNIDHDAVVMLSDWLHRSPEQVWAALRGPKSNPAGSTMQGSMPMGASSRVDLSDVAYDAFLINGRGNAKPWILKARPGERIRLRFINAGASTYFRLRLDRIPLTITHADGIAVQPVTVEHLLIGMAECYDAVVHCPRREATRFMPSRRMVLGRRLACCIRPMSSRSPIWRCRYSTAARCHMPISALWRLPLCQAARRAHFGCGCRVTCCATFGQSTARPTRKLTRC